MADLAANFARACDSGSGEVSEHVFSVAGSPVYVRVAGGEVARMLQRSLAPSAADGPGLTLELWDEVATGVGRGVFAGPGSDFYRDGPAGETLGLSPDGRYVRYAGADFEILLDRAAQHGVGWIRSEKLLSSWHRARPLQALLMSWMAARRVSAVHATMVARDGTGILLAGPAHAGKSTVTAACGAGGFDLLGDEAIALEVRDGRVIGHCVHAAVKLRSDGLERHPSLQGRTHHCGPPWQDELVAFLGEAFPGQVVASAEVAAVGLAELGEAQETLYSPLPPALAMRALTGCLLSVEPGNLGSAFDTVAEVIERVPAYRVSIGTATERVPEDLDAMLRQIRPVSPGPERRRT
jgi:hypothetical protein